MAKTEKTAEAVPATVQPFIAIPNPAAPAQFTPDPDQETWIALEKEREEKRAQNPAANPFLAAAEAGLMFINSPQNNDQWIGVRPEGDTYRGAAVSTMRFVPLGPEALQPGRKVVWPDGSESTIDGFPSGPEAVIHPETGESLIAAFTAKSGKKKAA